MTRPSGYTIFHTEASGGWGGQELRILAELDGLARRGYRTGLISEPGSPIAERARSLGRPVHPVRFRWSADPSAVRKVARILREEGVDLLGTHSSLDAWVGGIAARWCGVPVVRTRHLDIPLKRNPLSRMVYRLLADAVVVTGASGAARLVAEAGVPPERIHVVPTGIDLDRFDPARVDGSRIRRELGIEASAAVIGTIGVLRVLKGIDIFLRGCRAILDRNPAARFLVVGDGPMRREVRALWQALHLEGAAWLLGHREDIPELLAAMSVLVLPSLTGEGNPQVVSQAMAMGVPVVASALPGIMELARDGDTARLFPAGDAQGLADAVCRMLEDGEIRRRMASRGQALARARLSVDAMLDRIEVIYAGVVPGGHGRHAGRAAPRPGEPGERLRR